MSKICKKQINSLTYGSIYKNELGSLEYAGSTKCELDIYLYLCSIKNQYGFVKMMKIKYISDKLNICVKSVYNSLYSLRDKNIIELTSVHRKYGFYDIKILNNEYFKKEHYKEKPYFDISNFSFILSESFTKAKLNVKRIALKLLNCPGIGYNSEAKGLIYGFKIHYSKIKKWVQVNSQIMQEYIDDLRSWFDIDINNGLLTIYLKGSFEDNEHTNYQKYWFNELHTIKRKYDVKIDDENIWSLACLFAENKFKKDRFKYLIRAVKLCLKQTYRAFNRSIIQNIASTMYLNDRKNNRIKPTAFDIQLNEI